MRRDKRLLGATPAQRQQIAAIGTDLDHQPSSRNANGRARKRAKSRGVKDLIQQEGWTRKAAFY